MVRSFPLVFTRGCLSCSVRWRFSPQANYKVYQHTMLLPLSDRGFTCTSSSVSSFSLVLGRLTFKGKINYDNVYVRALVHVWFSCWSQATILHLHSSQRMYISRFESNHQLCGIRKHWSGTQISASWSQYGFVFVWIWFGSLAFVTCRSSGWSSRD